LKLFLLSIKNCKKLKQVNFVDYPYNKHYEYVF